VNRGVVVALDHLLGDEDRVLEVVTAPGHERDQHVSAERQFAAVRARAVSDDIALFDALSFANDRLLVDAGVLVRTLKFDERIDIRGDLARQRPVDIVIDAVRRSESTTSTTPSRLVTTTAPESCAVTVSIPVPMSGASARRSGTA
jgi:hypothetical protein